MKILFACFPATGHVNPLLVAARVLQKEGHEIGVYTGTLFREKIEAAGLRFFPLPADVDFDLRDVDAAFPDRKKYPPGLEKLRYDFSVVFAGSMESQYRGLMSILGEFPSDVVIHDTAFCGVLPLLLGPHPSRPASVYLGVLPLPLRREDGMPFGPGLLPAANEEQRKQYREITQRFDETVTSFIDEQANGILQNLGSRTLSAPLLESVVLAADLILQPCAESFEYPWREAPKNLHFIGALLPEGSGDVPPQLAEAKEAGRKVVLISQGTIANADLGMLVFPTIQALGDREDVLLRVTTGGKPVDSIPGPLSKNTVASPFLNFREILPHADVVVTFGGYGTVTQALSFGVPIVAAGLTEDKPENGTRVVWTGSGIYLRTDNPTAEELREAVESIFSDPSYRENAKRLAKEFAAHNPARELKHLIETLVADRQAASQALVETVAR
jgi:MGT family glycosyltransferase